jgi:hypothetical protein
MDARMRATTERGPRAAPRRGSKWAAPRCARGALRCSRRKGGCGTARRGAERATTSWLLAGPSPAAPDYPSRRCASRRPIFAPTGRRPRARETLVVSVDAYLGVAGKAVVGCAPAATYAAPRSAGLRRLRVALRRRAGHTLFELRAQRRCAAASRPREGKFVWPPSRPEHRRAAGRRPAAAFERRRIPGRGLASLGLGMHDGASR